jgi:hypothetical protein
VQACDTNHNSADTEAATDRRAKVPFSIPTLSYRYMCSFERGTTTAAAAATEAATEAESGKEILGRCKACVTIFRNTKPASTSTSTSRRILRVSCSSRDIVAVVFETTISAHCAVNPCSDPDTVSTFGFGSIRTSRCPVNPNADPDTVRPFVVCVHFDPDTILSGTLSSSSGHPC